MPKGKTGTNPQREEKSQQEAEREVLQKAAGNEKNVETVPEYPMHFDVKIMSMKPEDSIKATASLSINGAFAVRGIKVIEGIKGLFVSMPSYKAGNEYKDICFPVTKECRDQLHNAVLTAYENAVTQSQNSVQKHHGMKAPEGQPMEMAGM